MLAEGNMLADHTWSHANVSAGGSLASGQIASTASAIRKATGFRPACSARRTARSARSLIGARARDRIHDGPVGRRPAGLGAPGSGAIYSRIVGSAHNGSIVLMHDGGGPRWQTLAALPGIIHTLKRAWLWLRDGRPADRRELRYG